MMCLRQVEHFRGHLRHRYSITVNQVMVTSTLPKGTLGSVASLLAATLYQGNPDRNHKLWNIVSNERYILHELCLVQYSGRKQHGRYNIQLQTF
jgi:hypothetical protein